MLVLRLDKSRSLENVQVYEAPLNGKLFLKADEAIEEFYEEIEDAMKFTEQRARLLKVVLLRRSGAGLTLLRAVLESVT